MCPAKSTHPMLRPCFTLFSWHFHESVDGIKLFLKTWKIKFQSNFIYLVFSLPPRNRIGPIYVVCGSFLPIIVSDKILKTTFHPIRLEYATISNIWISTLHSALLDFNTDAKAISKSLGRHCMGLLSKILGPPLQLFDGGCRSPAHDYHNRTEEIKCWHTLINSC